MNSVEAAALASHLVNVILNDLHGRRGIGQELDQIDPAIYGEMENDLIELVTKELLKQP